MSHVLLDLDFECKNIPRFTLLGRNLAEPDWQEYRCVCLWKHHAILLDITRNSKVKITQNQESLVRVADAVTCPISSCI